MGGLKALLNDYKEHAGLAVHWVFVGPSGRETRAPTGGVLRDYTLCVREPTERVKTIVNTWFLAGTSVHPHNHAYRCVPCAQPAPPLAAHLCAPQKWLAGGE